MARSGFNAGHSPTGKRTRRAKVSIPRSQNKPQKGAARARFYSESMKAGTNTPACADRVTNIPGFLMVDERPRSVTSVITTSATSAGTSPLPLKILRKTFLKPWTLLNKTWLRSPQKKWTPYLQSWTILTLCCSCYLLVNVDKHHLTVMLLIST